MRNIASGGFKPATAECEVHAGASGAEGRGIDPSEDFEVFATPSESVPGAVDMVGDGPGKKAADERSSAGAYAVTTRACDITGDAGRDGSPGMVDGDASVPGEHEVGTPGGSTVMERTPAEAVPTKKRRAQKHSRAA